MELIDQFGPALGGALAAIACLVAVVRVLDSRAATMAARLEAQYERQIADRDKRIAALEAECEWWQRLTFRATDVSEGLVKQLEAPSFPRHG